MPLVVKAPPKDPEPVGRFWAEVDYPAWSVKGDHLPALVTSSPAGTPLAQAGVLGAPETSVLFGDSAVNLIPPAIPGGPQRLQPMFNTSSLVAQGFNVGVRYNY